MSKNETDLFYSALQSLPQFCEEMDADWAMVYDFMESQCGTLTDAQWEEVEAVYNPYLNDSRYWVYLTAREFFILAAADPLCQLGRCPLNPHSAPKSCIVFKLRHFTPMIVPFSEVCVGCSLVLNGLAGVKVSTRTVDFIVGEIDGQSTWKKMFVKQKENVRIADPGQGIVLSW